MNEDTEDQTVVAVDAELGGDASQTVSDPVEMSPPKDNAATLSPANSIEIGSPGSNLAARRMRQASFEYSPAERDALSQVAMDAEMKLTAKKMARAEARDIRMKEMEKQQQQQETEEQMNKESEQDNKEKRAMLSRQSTGVSVSSSRRSSVDSVDLDAPKPEYEEKYKKAMMTNAQLDNEKSTLTYEVEALKDMVEDRDEQMMEYQREVKEKHRELQAKKRENSNYQNENEHLRQLVMQRDQLIAEHGLRFISDNDDEEEANQDTEKVNERRKTNSQVGTIVVLSTEAAELLESSGDGPLDVRLKRLVEDRKDKMEQVRKLKIELEEEKDRVLAAERRSSSPSPSTNGPDIELLDTHRELTRQTTEYRYKLKRTEQEISTLEGTIDRLESQVQRYKEAAETSEKIEEELKAEKRKTVRELRSLRENVDELETENTSLKKRIDRYRKREIN